MLVVDVQQYKHDPKGDGMEIYTNEQPLQDADVQILKRYVQQLQFS